ncbi:MAG: hypothetical protein ACO3RV_04740, partial [Luteolibacter sp.]
MNDQPEKKARWVAVLLVVLPLWLLLSGIAGVWYFVHRDAKEEARVQQWFSRVVSEKSLAVKSFQNQLPM